MLTFLVNKEAISLISVGRLFQNTYPNEEAVLSSLTLVHSSGTRDCRLSLEGPLGQAILVGADNPLDTK